jgi:hypothetical protein
MDLVGPLPTAQGNYKFVAVVVDCFTKWVEVKAPANITAAMIQLLAKHNLQIRSSKRTDCRHWETIRLLFFQRILQDFGHS